MGERNQERKGQYKRVRTEFEDLEIEDKALFLLEATVSTVARGIEQIGRGFAEEFEKACRTSTQPKENAGDDATEHQNGAASTESPTDPTTEQP